MVSMATVQGLTMRCSEPLRASRAMLPTAFAPQPPTPAHGLRQPPPSLSLGSFAAERTPTRRPTENFLLTAPILPRRMTTPKHTL